MSGAVQRDELVVPADATTLEGFRRWRRTLGEDAPKVHYIDGDLWFDMSPQSWRTHLPVTTEINAVLRTISRDEGLGRYFGDGGWITHAEHGISNEPDGVFVSNEALSARRVRVSSGNEVELEGVPDMVLEVVSKTSERKDTVVLREKYAAAGVPEFWLVDARGLALRFQILTLDDGRYAAVAPDGDGFCASPVWGRAFRLRRVEDGAHPDFRLDAR